MYRKWLNSIKLKYMEFYALIKIILIDKLFIYEGKPFKMNYAKSNLQLTTSDLNFPHMEKTGRIFLFNKHRKILDTGI